MGGDHVLNNNWNVKLIIPLPHIFTDNQGVKIWLLDKSNSVCFM